MKKKSIVEWVFIVVFALISLGCLVFWLKSNVMLFYALCSGALAVLLYKGDKA